MNFLIFFVGFTNAIAKSLYDFIPVKYTREALSPDDIEHEDLHRALLEDSGNDYHVIPYLISLF